MDIDMENFRNKPLPMARIAQAVLVACLGAASAPILAQTGGSPDGADGALLDQSQRSGISDDSSPAQSGPESPEAAARDAADDGELEKVVVTARKISEDLQQVPIAVTAITAEQIERSHATRIEDVVRSPNGVFDNAIYGPTIASFFIRGLGSQELDMSFEPAVAVVLDGVFIGKMHASMIDSFDLESIEILRGPQGTLFGKNTIGGVINVRTRRPSGDYGFAATARIGNHGARALRASFDAPISEDLSMRVSMLESESEGYFYNAIKRRREGADDTRAGRISLAYRPNEALRMSLIADASRDRGDFIPVNNASTLIAGDRPLFMLLPLLGFPADADGDLTRVRGNYTDQRRSDNAGASFEIEYDLPALTLTSISGYRDYAMYAGLDGDGEPVDLLNVLQPQAYRQIFQELRVANRDGERFDLVAGLSYLQQSHRSSLFIDLDCNLFGVGGCPAPGVLDSQIVTTTAQISESYGVFAQGSYRISADFRITGGFRYSRDNKRFTFTETGFVDNDLGLAGLSLQSVLAGAPAPQQTRTFQESFGQPTWRIGADYRFSPALFGYVSVATGFKAGGFNGRASSFPQVGPYDEEKVLAYEVGLKADLLDRRLRWNTALFFNDYEDLQIEIVRNINNANTTLVSNAASVAIGGAETELSARLGRGFSLRASLGYLDAQYRDFFADVYSTGVATDVSDLKLRRAPTWTWSATLDYRRQYAVGDLWWQLDWSYQSGYETSVQNYALGRRSPDHLFNAAIGYNHADGRFGVSLFGRNLTNQVSVANAFVAPPFSAINEPTQPRMYGLEISYRY
jgi:iron complex outermembrane receptor protein